MDMNRISITVLAKNSEKYIERCLDALSPFDEVVVLDNGSTDETIPIVRRFPNVKLLQNDFTGFGPMKNLAAEHTSNDWILNVDSDEILSPELVDELQTMALDSNKLYKITRINHYGGRWLRACGWSPDHLPLLYDKKKTSFNESLVHEGIIVKEGMSTQKLKGTVRHYPYDSVDDLIVKMQLYSSLFARAQQGKRKSSPAKAFGLAIVTFFKHYFLGKGIFFGYEGLLVAIHNANTVFYKYAKLYEINRR